MPGLSFLSLLAYHLDFLVAHRSYWTMHFDASPESQKALRSILRKDPRVIRATVLKMGEKIEDVATKKEMTARNLTTGYDI